MATFTKSNFLLKLKKKNNFIFNRSKKFKISLCSLILKNKKINCNRIKKIKSENALKFLHEQEALLETTKLKGRFLFRKIFTKSNKFRSNNISKIRNIINGTSLGELKKVLLAEKKLKYKPATKKGLYFKPVFKKYFYTVNKKICSREFFQF